MELNGPPNTSSDSPDEPVFPRASAPEHGAGFWGSLEAELHADSVASQTVVPGVEVAPGPTGQLAAVPSAGAPVDRTEQLVAIAPQSEAPDASRRWQVLAAAAAVLFVGLLSFGMLRNNGNVPGEVVAAGELTPAAASAALTEGEGGDSTPDEAQPTATPEPVATTSAAAPAAQPDSGDADSGDSDSDESNGNQAAPTAGADGNDQTQAERFLVQNDQQLLFFAETIPTGATNCTYADQNVLVVRAPDGSSTTLAGRIYPHIDQMIVNGDLFALVSSDCNGAQMLELGRIESAGRLVSTQTFRGRVSDGSPAVFQGINLDAQNASVSFEDARAGTTDFSPQVVDIDPPLDPTPVPTPAPTATPKPLPTLPPDTGFADRARLIGSTVDGDIDWFAVTDPSTTCGDDDYSQIMVVAAGGPANLVHSPQFTYSGDIAFFAADPASRYVAFVATCGSQIELHVGTLGNAGTFVRSDLAWVGLGSPDNALVVWDGDTVSLNSLQQDGTPFFVQYEPATRRIIDSNIPATSVDDGGAPEGIYPSPLGASPDGRTVYFNGLDPATSGGCEGESNTIWVQNPTGDWAQATPSDLNLDVVSAFALEGNSSQVAFAETCENIGSTLYIGLTQPDGLIINLRSVSMQAYVPGSISNLFWIDASRLRIETDNSAFGVEPKRFEYDLRADVIVQLDR